MANKNELEYARMKTTTPAAAAADYFTNFKAECKERNIVLERTDLQKINGEFRSLYKKFGNKLSSMDFDATISEFSSTYAPIAEYINKQHALELEKISSVQESVEEPQTAPDQTPAEAEEEQVIQDQSESVSSENIVKTNTEIIKTDSIQSQEKFNAAPEIMQDDLLSSILGYHPINDRRKINAINEEIRKLSKKRDLTTRQITFSSTDFAIIRSIMGHADSLEDETGKSFLNCSMDNWIGVIHASLMCLIEKMKEHDKKDYMNAIYTGVNEENERRQKINMKIIELESQKNL